MNGKHHVVPRETTRTPRSWACGPLSFSSFLSFLVPGRLLDTPYPRHLMPIHDTTGGRLTRTERAPQVSH